VATVREKVKNARALNLQLQEKIEELVAVVTKIMKGDMAWMKDPVNKVLGDLNALTDVANNATASLKGM
jgi:hypothetical protein